MKLFKVRFKKGVTTKPKHFVLEILEKYPNANVNDIFATMSKHGFTACISTIRSYKSEFTRARAIKLAMGVK